MLARAMRERDCILDESKEFRETRLHSYNSARMQTLTHRDDVHC